MANTTNITVIDTSTGTRLGVLVREEGEHYVYALTRRGKQRFMLARKDRAALKAA